MARFSKSKFTLVDLFAGCGGMTRGFVDSGRFEPVFAVEFDADAADDLRARTSAITSSPAPIEDVDDVPDSRRRDRRAALPGLLAAQLRGVGLERRALWREYLRALEAGRAATRS